MKKSHKKLIASIVACVLAGTMAFNGTMAYLTDAEGAVNIATVGKVNIDLEEPGYPGNDSDEVKSILPNQEIVKDPQVENTGDNSAIVYLKVDVPQETFTELSSDGMKGERKLQDLFALKGLSENWELIKTETSTDADTAKTKTTYVYAYRKTLDKGAKTDKLFEKVQMKNAVENDLSGKVEDIVIQACAIQATDIPDVDLAADENGYLKTGSLFNIYGIFMAQSGDKDVRPADEGNRAQNGKLGKITYVLDGGTLPADALTEYGSDDFGYAPPTPTKTDYKFIGWEPAQIPVDSTGNVTFTAKWDASTAELLSGERITVKMKKLAGNSSASYISKDTAITAIQRSNEAPSDAVMEDANSLISLSTSGKPVYAWFEDGTIKWWSDAEYVNASSDLSCLCYAMLNLTDINGLSNWNTVNVTDMSSMFCGCKQLTTLTPLANWQTGKVTDMCDMFRECSQLTELTPLANWQTGKVTNMNSMFHECSQLTELTPLANWDTSNVTKMNAMFRGCSQLTNLTGLANWQTGNVTSMSGMFAGCSQLTNLTPLADWQTANVTNMSGMFRECNKLTDLSSLANWQTDKVTTMEQMFYGCSQLTKLTNLAKWDTGNVTDMSYMFYECSSLTNLTGLANWQTGKVTNMSYMFEGCSRLTNLTGLANWQTGNVTKMWSMFDGCSQLTDASAINDWNIAKVGKSNGFSMMFRECPSHPEFTKRAGRWNSNGTFTPTT